MSNIKFVSHEEFPEDQYTKEMVYLLIDDKFRVAYVRKQAKNGGMFWGVPSVTVTKDGVKTFYETFMQDSNFLERDIKHFLDSRSWMSNSSNTISATKSSFVDSNEELPF